MDEREETKETTAEPAVEEALQGSVPLDAWLDDQEAERRALIMRLRQIERNLMAHGRLRTPWATAVQETGTGR